MKPTLGRIVLYTSLGDADGKYPAEAHPAIITKVTVAKEAWRDPRCDAHEYLLPDGRCTCVGILYNVSLHVFYETGGFDMKDVPFSEEPRRGCWSWPPRV